MNTAKKYLLVEAIAIVVGIIMVLSINLGYKMGYETAAYDCGVTIVKEESDVNLLTGTFDWVFED